MTGRKVENNQHKNNVWKLEGFKHKQTEQKSIHLAVDSNPEDATAIQKIPRALEGERILKNVLYLNNAFLSNYIKLTK